MHLFCTCKQRRRRIPQFPQITSLALASILAALVQAEQRAAGAETQSKATDTATDSAAAPARPDLVAQGHELYLKNCAHCHATDATGDEGPDLHGVDRSDASITNLIKNGKKGQMPRFGAKLSDADVQALIAFIRSLK